MKCCLGKICTKQKVKHFRLAVFTFLKQSYDCLVTVRQVVIFQKNPLMSLSEVVTSSLWAEIFFMSCSKEESRRAQCT